MFQFNKILLTKSIRLNLNLNSNYKYMNTSNVTYKISNIYKQIKTKPTIYGLATGPIIKSGVAVIRISGPESKQCLLELLSNQSKLPKSRVASIRKLYCPLNQQDRSDNDNSNSGNSGNSNNNNSGDSALWEFHDSEESEEVEGL